MVSARLAGAIIIQATTFLGPLLAAPAGLISGQVAGVAAPILWFSAGIPLSYWFLDRRPAPQPAASRRKVLRPVRL